MAKLASKLGRFRELETDHLLRLAKEDLDEHQLRDVVSILGERVKMAERHESVIRLTNNLSMQTELAKALHELVVGAAILTRAEVSTLFLVNVEKQTLEVAASVYFDPTKFKASMTKPDATCFGLDQGVIGLTMDVVSLGKDVRKKRHQSLTYAYYFYDIKLQSKSSIAGYCALSGESLNVLDARRDPRFSSAWDEEHSYRTNTLLCSPLIDNHGKVLGVLECLNKIDEDVRSFCRDAVLLRGVEVIVR